MMGETVGRRNGKDLSMKRMLQLIMVMYLVKKSFRSSLIGRLARC
jgi:hypothetical protein